jgi:Putative outer membrane beta-barrel porin, MtrB/PioB
MKRTRLPLVVLLAFCPPAFAQEEDYSFGSGSIGLLQRDSDTISSKFLEYRDIPQGAVAPLFTFDGKKGDFRYSFLGRDITQKDQLYFLNLSTGAIRIEGNWVGIPHNFGNGGKTILNPVGETDWRISDTTQAAYQAAIVAVPPSPAGQIDYDCRPRPGFTPSPTCFSLLRLVTPGLEGQPANIDLKLTRGRGNVALSFAPKDASYDVGITYLHERRSGTRAANGTSFGFGNVIETPEPLRYITQDFGVHASFAGDWGSAKAAIHYNDFKNSFDTFTWDNWFRVTDSSDSSAYQSPSTSTRNGASFARMALVPDNNAWTESLGATVKLGARTRITADLAFGQWKQDEDPFIPWTTNTAVLTPSGEPAATLALPGRALDGKINTTSLAGYLTSRLTDDLGLNVRYRRYDRDNETRQYEIDGYVRFDAVWEDIGRRTVPFGYTNDIFDAALYYAIGKLNLEGGWKYNRMSRTFRETSEWREEADGHFTPVGSGATSENLFKFVADVRGDWYMLRGLAEVGSRDLDSYDAVAAEDYGFLEPGSPANQTVLRRYDQAKRDVRRFGGQLEISPGSGELGAFASYVRTELEYDQAPVSCEDVELFPGQSTFCAGGVQRPLGLQKDTYDTFTLEANYTPNTKTRLYAFYSWEDIDQIQTGRQSGSTLDFNPLNVWTADVVNKVNSFGAGVDFDITPKWFLGLFARYQKVDGNNDVSLPTGFSTSIYGTNPALLQCTAGNAANPCAIPEFDDTKLTYVSAWVKYKVAKHWSAAVGLSFEDYEVDDSQTGNLLNYMPASFFLQANNRNYQAWVGWLNLTYSWY